MKLCYHCMQQIKDERLHTCPNCKKSLQLQQVPSRYLRPGTVLQRKFVVGYPLGAGGFGNTYIGWNQVLLRKVAVKEFYPEQYSGRSADGVTVTVSDGNLQPRFRKGLQQFLEEARSVAALQDIKGVVAISNFFEENGTGYIVMEYLEGMDVKTILKKSGDKKDYEWSRRVILTVLHTLREIHKRGVLHRDIAPDNIFVTNEGVIKLIDFGAARHASALANMKSEVILKVGYAPIEQYSRSAAQGPYTDLYAVAALFYRLLTGQKPLPANERIQQDSLIPPSDMGIQIPEQAEMGMMVCLNVKPEYRLQTADEFMEALDGKYFIPVYEPEWILPPTEDKSSFLGRISRLPVAAKAAICFGAICLMGGIVAGAVVIGNSNTQSVEGPSSTIEAGKFRVEDYAGKRYEDAVSNLKRQGAENVAEPVYDFSSETEGAVTGQSIEPSEVVDVGSEVSFTVSGGDHYYTMPDFEGYEETDVIQFFTDRMFAVVVYDDPYDMEKHTVEGVNENLAKKTGKIIINRKFSKDIDAGVCYEQTVTAGERCEAEREVVISVSVGGTESDFIKNVPDFSGMTEDEAKETLKKSALKDVLKMEFEPSSEYLDGILAGQVNSQSVEAGKKMNLFKDKGEKITLYIQKEKPKPKTKPKAKTKTKRKSNPKKKPKSKPKSKPKHRG